MPSSKYIIALFLVIVFAITYKIMNPHQKYSTQEYWESATLEDVYEIPDEALHNDTILMIAATATDDPAIIKALVEERGADINEVDPIFTGTPLTGAAAYSKYPEIIRELVALGANIDVRVLNKDTVLMVAAKYNTNPGIVEELVALGADPTAVNAFGETALTVARNNNNTIAANALSSIE